jgi:hypothetical protein
MQGEHFYIDVLLILGYYDPTQERTSKMKTVKKSKRVADRRVALKIYFLQNGEMRSQIEEDAKRFGVSQSQIANMYIRAGRPLVVKTLEKSAIAIE